MTTIPPLNDLLWEELFAGLCHRDLPITSKFCFDFSKLLHFFEKKNVMICFLVGLSLQRAEAEVQRPIPPMGDRKGKRVLDGSEDALKAKKCQCHQEETLVPRVGKASFWAIDALVDEDTQMIVTKATRIVKVTLVASCKAMETVAKRPR